MLLRALLALLLLVTRCLVQLPSIICDILFFFAAPRSENPMRYIPFFSIPHRNNNNTTITPLSLLLSWLFPPNPFPFLNAKQVSFSPLSSLDMSRNQWSFGFLHTIMGILMWERLRKGICDITALCPQVAPSSPQISPPQKTFPSSFSSCDAFVHVDHVNPSHFGTQTSKPKPPIPTPSR